MHMPGICLAYVLARDRPGICLQLLPGICDAHARLMLGTCLACGKHMPCICNRDNLYIRKTQRIVVVSTAVEATSFLLIGGKNFLQVRAPELARRLYCAIELVCCCIAEMGFTM